MKKKKKTNPIMRWPASKKPLPKPTKKNRVPITTTAMTQPMGAGSHELLALQQHKGIVKKPLMASLCKRQHKIKQARLSWKAAAA